MWTIWHGNRMKAFRNVLNSIRNTRLLFLPLLTRPRPDALGQEQGPPGFQVPGQRRHHHVGPVAHQVVDRRVQGPHAALELRVQVFLIAAIVGLEHDFGRRSSRSLVR